LEGLKILFITSDPSLMLLLIQQKSYFVELEKVGLTLEVSRRKRAAPNPICKDNDESPAIERAA